MRFNSRDPACKTPFGAVKTGEEIAFSLRLLASEAAHSPKLLIFIPDCWDTPSVIPMELVCSDYLSSLYRCQVSFSEAGLWFYCFEATVQGGVKRIYRSSSGDGVFDLSSPSLWQQTVYEKDFSTPSFFSKGIVYQIFPDRFCRSGQPKDDVPSDRFLRSDWGNLPDYLPNQNGEVTNNDYFCGDLKGIEEKLPYLESLGVGCIYLNPIFEAHSNHRYNTANYERIDPLLGREEDFASLCKEAKKHGISILLDGVFNHTGSDSIYFNKNRRYGSGGAYNDPDSPYRSWYHFTRYPEEYDCWWGFQTLPNLNEGEKSYQDYLCGVLEKYLRLGAAGYRLDVVDELPDSLVELIRSTVKRVNPDAILIGEVWEDASNKVSYGSRRRYLFGRELDGVMDYPLRSAILSYIKYGNASQLYETLLTLLENYPPPVIPCLMNSLSTHDTERAITVLGGKELGGHDRNWQAANHYLNPEEYRRGRELLLLASALQYFLPGAPTLYYGDEAGLSGYKDPFNRVCYPWGHEDMGMVQFFQTLGSLRRRLSALQNGGFVPLLFSDSLLLFLRTGEEGKVLFALNRGDLPQSLPLPPEFVSLVPQVLLGSFENGLLMGKSALYLVKE